MIAVRGSGSAIMTALRPMLPALEWPIEVPRQEDMPLCADRYLFCSGLLRSIPGSQQTREEREEGFRVNLWRITDDCERILDANDRARICVIGSESAYRGSFDDTYANAKRCLHEYVERKKLKPDQQLVCISPGVIEDAGMNVRREDEFRTLKRKEANPKKRFLKAVEVARLIHFVLYHDQGYLTSVVVRLNGGEHNA